MGINLYREYLPPQLNVEELKAIVAEVVAETSAASLKDMGKVMKVLMPRVKGLAEGKVVNEVVREQLEAV